MIQIPTWANYLARDKGGMLFAYLERPEKTIYKIWDSEDVTEPVYDPEDQLSFIQREDTEPWSVQQDGNYLVFRKSGEEFQLHQSATEILLDPANHPNHYNVGGIETIDIIRTMLTPEEFQGYCKGNILKYRERAEHKGNPEEDYAKARKYMEFLKESCQ